MNVRDRTNGRVTGVLSWLIVAAGLTVHACSSEVPPSGDWSETSSALATTVPAEEPPAETIQAPDGHQDHRASCAKTTMAAGSTGHVEISDFFVGATFYSDDVILRAKGHPECVAHIQSADEALAPAGTLTVSSETVGTPDGPAAPFAIHPDSRNEYYEFPDPPLFNFPDGSKVEVQLEGRPGFPSIPVTTLRSPAFGSLNVTAPTLPESSELTVSSTEPLKFEWDIPTTEERGSMAARRPARVSVRLFALSPGQWGELYCHWPASAGRGIVPVDLLSEFRRQLGSAGALDAVVDMFAGDFKELASAKSSYVLFVTTDFVTTFPRSTSVLFE